MSDIPRPEHPRPQFMREKWLNLNGTWKFAIDHGVSGEQRGWAADPSALDREITVPFCPESSLSGIAYTDFMACVWYSREFHLPVAWLEDRIFLHFGAVDFDCRVWVNGQWVGRHYGGSSSFSLEITSALQPGDNTITVCALDDVRSGDGPSGKQSPAYHSHGCVYTRVTGIWQTVWLEARPSAYIDRVRIVSDIEAGRFLITPTFSGTSGNAEFRIVVSSEGETIAAVDAPARNGVPIPVDIAEPCLWSPEDPYLYDIMLQVADGEEIDTVRTYAGLREVRVEGNRVLLNGKPVFLRLVLDQGFYPDGIWTASCDSELRADIERSIAVGFNGARLHQKVFEERFHYWADRLGYLTWGEYCDWGAGHGRHNVRREYNEQMEWREIVLRDMNHPSIIAWTPANETHAYAANDRERHRRYIQDLVDATRALDPSRPVNDASGYIHVDTDIYTVHNYNQDVERFAEEYAALAPDARDGFQRNFPELTAAYNGQPFIVDEYGGTWWVPVEQRENEEGRDHKKSWGYGNAPQSIEEVYGRIEGLTKVLTDHPHMSGFCYTQLTDVEQEKNGIYTYDRVLKFDAERLRRAFGGPAAMEEE